MNAIKFLVAFVLVVAIVALSVEAHKPKFYNSAPVYEHERCVCDCAQPVLPNKPYYGSAGYHQPMPHRPSGGGYGQSGAYAVSGSYGSGSGQASGGY